jgi:hypothetical protein
MTIKATIELARSAGKDAGDRSMRSAGRSTWNAEDYAEATRVCNRILDGEPAVAQRDAVMQEARDCTAARDE